MIIPIRKLGRLGVIQDQKPYNLPPEAWSNLRNVRTRDGGIHKVFGYNPVLGTPEVAPVWLMPAFTTTNDFWIYASEDGEVYAVDGVTHAEIATSLGGARANRWNGGMFNGFAIINNGIANPQEWEPDLGNNTASLSNWPANTKASIIRPFGSFLVAYDVTKSGVRNPFLVKWSASADPEEVPPSWDETDEELDAGEWALAQSKGRIVDAKDLGQTNFIYKEDEIHAMTFVGGNFIFDFKRRFKVGLLAQDCLVEFRGRHYVATQDDIVVHDGFNMESVLQDRMRTWYAGRPDPQYSHLSYMASCGEELWLCFAEAGETEPNIALVVNLIDRSQTIRELPQLAFIATAAIDPDSEALNFDAIETPFDQMVGQFGQRNFAPGRDRFVGAKPDSTEILLLDQDFDNDGENFTAYVERTGLAVAGIDRHGEPYVDATLEKLVLKVLPKATFLNGEDLKVFVGGQEYEEGPVTWQAPQLYNPATAPWVECDVTTPYIALRFESTDDTWWRLDEYSLEVHVVGKNTP